MAIDFQIAYPQRVIQLNRIRFMPRNPGVPVSLDIIGEDFRAIDEVLINEIVSPDVIVVSKTRIIAQLPESLQRTLNVNSVTVTSRQLSLSSKSKIKFRISNTPGRVSGILRLLQMFLKLLFTTPGSDIHFPKLGGNGLQPIGETFGADEGRGIVSKFVISVDTTAKQLIAIQSRDTKLPRDERLLSARVTSAGFNKDQSALSVTVEVISQAGRTAIANLEP